MDWISKQGLGLCSYGLCSFDDVFCLAVFLLILDGMLGVAVSVVVLLTCFLPPLVSFCCRVDGKVCVAADIVPMKR